VRSNFGLDFSISNNDDARPTLLQNLDGGPLQKSHPFTSSDELQRYSREGELAYYDRRKKEALSWVRSHPGRFALLSLQRIQNFWFPVAPSPITTFYLWGITVAGAVGMARAFSHARSAAIVLSVFWFAFPLIYYVIEVDTRYRYPLDWSFLLLSCFACLPLLSRAQSWIFGRKALPGNTRA
jgi:hypothetical protein